MDDNQNNPSMVDQQMYNHAARLLLQTNKNAYDVKLVLMQQGLNEDSANLLIERVQEEIAGAQKTRANKDMLYGGLWFIGGTVLTLSNTGFIFWGAIIFGGAQFCKGAMNAIKN